MFTKVSGWHSFLLAAALAAGCNGERETPSGKPQPGPGDDEAAVKSKYLLDAEPSAFGNIRIVDAHHIGTRPTEVHRMLSNSLRYDRGHRPTIDAQGREGKLRLTSAGTEICPWAVSREREIAIARV